MGFIMTSRSSFKLPGSSHLVDLYFVLAGHKLGFLYYENLRINTS